MERWSAPKRVGFFVCITLLLITSFFLFKVEKTFSLMNLPIFSKIIHLANDEEKVPQEKNRIDILLLGIRGKDDIENGGYLTDTIMVFSLKTDARTASLVSIPRDLYLTIPGLYKMEKINAAYAFGKEKNGDGATPARLAVRKATGINIDYVVTADFSAFKKLIDIVGGIDVYVPHDFSEPLQWGNEFFVPRGMNRMNGDVALYYARSRYSTNDFDRARRQQDILEALANRLVSGKTLASPVTISKVLDAVSDGVETDIDFVTMLGLLKYTKTVTADDITRMVIDDSEGGLLVSSHINNMYVLYPRMGIENYSEIKQRIAGLFSS